MNLLLKNQQILGENQAVIFKMLKHTRFFSAIGAIGGLASLGMMGWLLYNEYGEELGLKPRCEGCRCHCEEPDPEEELSPEPEAAGTEEPVGEMVAAEESTAYDPSGNVGIKIKDYPTDFKESKA